MGAITTPQGLKSNYVALFGHYEKMNELEVAGAQLLAVQQALVMRARRLGESGTPQMQSRRTFYDRRRWADWFGPALARRPGPATRMASGSQGLEALERRDLLAGDLVISEFL